MGANSAIGVLFRAIARDELARRIKRLPRPLVIVNWQIPSMDAVFHCTRCGMAFELDVIVIHHLAVDGSSGAYIGPYSGARATTEYARTNR